MKRFLIVLALVAAVFAPTFAQAQTAAQKEQARRVISEEFVKYPKPHAAATTGKILNDAALRAPGWVLLGKKGGNRCPLPDGRDISCDFFVFEATRRGWDVIGSVGAADSNVSGPTSSAGDDMNEHLSRGSRTLEKPVGSAPPSPPPPPPPPAEDLKPTLEALRARIAALEGMLQSLAEPFNTNARTLASLLGAFEDEVANRKSVDDDLGKRLDVLVSRPIPDGCAVQFVRCRLTYNAP